MTFYDLIDQATALLQQRGRLSYRAMKRQFELDDAQLDDLKFELIEAEGVAVDQDGTVLVWIGQAETKSSPPDTRGDEPGPPATRSAPAAPHAREPQSGAAPHAREPQSGAAPESVEAERRQLSVLFCDLAGSTALGAQLDPEELREVLRDYQTVCARLVERFGGVVARQVGDGLLVNFGYPRAHEDDAARAVRAGLAIVAAMPELNGSLARRFRALESHPLQVRIGLHTGLVVIGALGDSTYRDPMAVVGETPNIAARLQGLAAPDTVVVSGATHRLLGGAFVCDDLGPQVLKGMAAPVPVYCVLREREIREPAAVSPTARLIPLLGREQEFGVLLDRWEQSKEGLGQFVLLSGEAGIGKSRLVRELKARVADEPHILLEGRGSPYHQQSAFHPWIVLLERALSVDRGDSAEAKGEKLERGLRQYRLPIPEMFPVLATLVGIPIEAARVASLGATPQRQRQQTLETLQGLVLQLTAEQPVLTIIEDLHWADPSTLEVLELLLQQAETARLLLVLTARPDFVVPWRHRAPLTSLTLTRLRRAQVERLMTAVGGGRSLPAEVVEQVARKTDGVPLFVEELTKMVLESELVREGTAGYELAGPLPPLAIPATLQDSLMARLDRLATTKVVAQVGATVGRSFTYELVQAVTGLDDRTLVVELGKLVEAELLYQRGLPPAATYSFKHALIQDAAYGTLLKSTRQQYHHRVGHVLETRFPDTVQDQPEILAHHYTEAGLSAQAIPYWQRAGQRAIERSGTVEAVAHLTRGLELLKSLPEAPERVQRELDLLTALGPALLITKGQGAPEAARAYTRARELCRQIGEAPQLFPVLWGLWYFYLGRADYATARELGEQLLGTAQRAGDPGLLLLAHRVLGQVLFFQGQFAGAHRHLEQAIALYDPREHRALVFQYAQDPEVAVRSYAALASWALGEPDRALRQSYAALARARELSHPYTLAFALGGVVWLHQYRREPQEIQKQVDELIALGTEHGFAYLLARGTVLRGWMLAELGQPEEGIAQISQGIAALRARGAEIWRPYWLTLLAEAHGKAGQAAEGLGVVDEAMAAVGNTGERWWEAESHRVKGELLLMQPASREMGGLDRAPQAPRARRAPGNPGRSSIPRDQPSAVADAEACFLRAIEVAREQGAKSLELRAMTSLGRLWQDQGKTAEAGRRLAEVYGRFTEGFEAPDLREARALLGCDR